MVIVFSFTTADRSYLHLLPTKSRAIASVPAVPSTTKWTFAITAVNVSALCNQHPAAISRGCTCTHTYTTHTHTYSHTYTRTHRQKNAAKQNARTQFRGAGENK